MTLKQRDGFAKTGALISKLDLSSNARSDSVLECYTSFVFRLPLFLFPSFRLSMGLAEEFYQNLFGKGNGVIDSEKPVFFMSRRSMQEKLPPGIQKAINKICVAAFADPSKKDFSLHAEEKNKKILGVLTDHATELSNRNFKTDWELFQFGLRFLYTLTQAASNKVTTPLSTTEDATLEVLPLLTSIGQYMLEKDGEQISQVDQRKERVRSFSELMQENHENIILLDLLFDLFFEGITDRFTRLMNVTETLKESSQAPSSLPLPTISEPLSLILGRNQTSSYEAIKDAIIELGNRVMKTMQEGTQVVFQHVKDATGGDHEETSAQSSSLNENDSKSGHRRLTRFLASMPFAITLGGIVLMVIALEVLRYSQRKTLTLERTAKA